MANIGSLVSTLSLDSSQFNKGINNAQRTLRSNSAKMNRQLARMERGWKSVRKSVLNWQSAMGAAAGAAGMGYMIQRTMEGTQQLSRQAEMAGTTVQAMQELQFAGRQLGVRQGNITDAMKEMNVRMQDFIQTGAGPAKDAFDVLNMSQQEVQRATQDTDQAFMNIIRRLQQMDESKAMNLADQIFGGQGAEAVISLIEQGSGSIEEMRQKARDLGITLDEETVQASNEAYQSIKTLTSQIQSTFATALGEIAPQLENTAEGMGEWVQNNKELLRQDIPATLNAIGEGLSFIGDKLKLISVDLPRGLAGLVYGPETAEGQTKQDLKELRGELDSVALKINKLTSGQAELTTPQQKALEKLRQKEAELVQQIAIRTKTLQRMNSEQEEATESAMTLTEADKMLWESMARVNEEVERGNKAKKEQLGLEERIANQLQTHEDVLRDQRTRAMRPPMVSEGELAPAKDVDAGMGAVTSADDKFISDFQDRMEQADSLAQETANSMSNAFDGWANSALDDLNQFVWGADKAFDDVLESFGQMLTKMMLKQAVLEPAGQAVSMGASSLMSSLFSGPAAPGTAGFNPPAMADGGYASAGSTYLVGERGPELLHMGKQGGQITPNDQIGGGTEIHIHEAPQGTQVKRQKKAGGGERIDVMLDRQMAQNIGKGGETAQMLETKYGLSPNLASR